MKIMEESILKMKITLKIVKIARKIMEKSIEIRKGKIVSLSHFPKARQRIRAYTNKKPICLRPASAKQTSAADCDKLAEEV